MTKTDKWRNALLIAVGAVMLSLSLSACTPHETHRVKVTVTVDDNGVQRSGSSVMQFTCYKSNNSLGGMGIGGCDLKGEAVPVDLGAKGKLFMLLCGSNSYQMDGVIGDIMDARYGADSWDLDPDELPRLVTFDNLADPRTVEAVDPQHIDKNFGAGVRLRSIHAEYTREPITRGQIERVLPWLEGPRQMLDGRGIVTTNNLSSQLSTGHFKTGD